ncbi:MAG: VOC family protein [Proteobacteria bacterium]|nr:VOC family protein [Pseudomonadota bacterium]MBS0463684.1 VOC family protein [Pseudomonadota bacterium]
MKLVAYLNFDGTCEAAFRFYEQALGGTITRIDTFGGSPMAAQMPPEAHARIIHVRLQVGEQCLMGSDTPPGALAPRSGFAVAIQSDDLAQAQRCFHALADGGRIDMPFQATFWSPGFGMLVDRFGVPWMVNCEAAPA